jgi:hypothetical protein
MSQPYYGPCLCHECQGIHCLVWHPGHSHRERPPYRDWVESGLIRGVYAGTFTLRVKSPDDHLGAVEGDKS